MTTERVYFGEFSGGRYSILRQLVPGAYWGGSQNFSDWLSRNPLFPNEDEILFATYDQSTYEGYAKMLFTRNGRLYEYSASHCSCRGLEDDIFCAGETSWLALAKRDPDGFLFNEDYSTPEAVAAVRALIAANLSVPTHYHVIGDGV